MQVRTYILLCSFICILSTVCLAETPNIRGREGTFQEQILQIVDDKQLIFTYSEKLIRIQPSNQSKKKAKVVRLSDGKEITLEQLRNDQWILVKGDRFYDYEKHIVNVDATIIYALSSKLSSEELKKF